MLFRCHLIICHHLVAIKLCSCSTCSTISTVPLICHSVHLLSFTLLVLCSAFYSCFIYFRFASQLQLLWHVSFLVMIQQILQSSSQAWVLLSWLSCTNIIQTDIQLFIIFFFHTSVMLNSSPLLFITQNNRGPFSLILQLYTQCYFNEKIS